MRKVRTVKAYTYYAPFSKSEVETTDGRNLEVPEISSCVKYHVGSDVDMVTGRP
jgi:hypothetical protein